jgi:hypothetical protein
MGRIAEVFRSALKSEPGEDLGFGGPAEAT